MATTHINRLGALYDPMDGSISVIGGRDGRMLTMTLNVESVFECCVNHGKLLAESGMTEGMLDLRILHSEEAGFELDIRFVRSGELWSWRRGEDTLLEMFDDLGHGLLEEAVKDLGAQIIEALDIAEEDDEPETVH